MWRCILRQDALLHTHWLRAKVQRVRICINSAVGRAVTCRKPVPKYSTVPPPIPWKWLPWDWSLCWSPAAPAGLEAGAAGVRTPLVLSLLWLTWEFITACGVSGLGWHLALLQLELLDLLCWGPEAPGDCMEVRHQDSTATLGAQKGLAGTYKTFFKWAFRVEL